MKQGCATYLPLPGSLTSYKCPINSSMRSCFNPIRISMVWSACAGPTSSQLRGVSTQECLVSRSSQRLRWRGLAIHICSKLRKRAEDQIIRAMVANEKSKGVCHSFWLYIKPDRLLIMSRLKKHIPESDQSLIDHGKFGIPNNKNSLNSFQKELINPT